VPHARRHGLPLPPPAARRSGGPAGRGLPGGAVPGGGPLIPKPKAVQPEFGAALGGLLDAAFQAVRGYRVVSAEPHEAALLRRHGPARLHDQAAAAPRPARALAAPARRAGLLRGGHARGRHHHGGRRVAFTLTLAREEAPRHGLLPHLRAAAAPAASTRRGWLGGALGHRPRPAPAAADAAAAQAMADAAAARRAAVEVTQPRVVAFAEASEPAAG
jgi:hypothetical protein